MNVVLFFQCKNPYIDVLQVLYKMLKREVFEEIHGCISTGKEANVYHAVTKEGQDYAVKIFKTSILQFRDRDRYFDSCTLYFLLNIVLHRSFEVKLKICGLLSHLLRLSRYVSGDFRFRHGYCRHNPRKMVQAWAEKEMRNLSRMYDAGRASSNSPDLVKRSNCKSHTPVCS